MKILGHPLHVILIHFPSALFPMDLACSVYAYNGGPAALTEAAFFASFGGVILGCVAAITGAFDLVEVVKDKPRSVKKALVHGGINAMVLLGFMVYTFIAFKHYPALRPDELSELLIKTVLVILLGIGNFFGGSLILKDGIAVRKTNGNVS